MFTIKLSHSVKSLFFAFIFSLMSLPTFAQNTKIEITAEKVKDGIKIIKTENGKTSEFVYKVADAKKFLEQFGENLKIDVEEKKDGTFKMTLVNKEGETETILFNLTEVIDAFEINFEDLEKSITDFVEEMSSKIEYEETKDKNGNKTIKIKTSDKSKNGK